MPSSAPLIRRSTIAIWIVAALAAVLAQVLMGAPPLGLSAWAGAAVLAALLALGDMAAVVLEDGSSLSPAPALLIAGLAIAGWPLVLVATLLGALPALARRAPAQQLRLVGARCLVVALIALIYWLTEPPTQPFSTPQSLLGLVLMGVIAYAAELLFTIADAPPRDLPARWSARFQSWRWYALAMIPLGGLLGALWSLGPWAFCSAWRR